MLRAVPVLGKFRVNLDDIQLDGLDLSDANTGANTDNVFDFEQVDVQSCFY